MKSRLRKVLSALATPIALMVLVIILGFSFLAIVLVPGLELASEVADSSTALKLLGEQQRHPTLIRASLESMRERLGDRGYIQESVDQLRTSSAKLDAAIHEMTLAQPVGWFALAADTGLAERHRPAHVSKGCSSMNRARRAASASGRSAASLNRRNATVKSTW